MRAYDPDIVDVILDEDTDIEPTIWKIQRLNADQMRHVLSQTNIPSSNYQATLLGLKGWEGFPDKQGNEVPYKTCKMRISGVLHKIVHPDVLRMIPGMGVQLLGNRIIELSALTGPEAKNSGSQSRSLEPPMSSTAMPATTSSNDNSDA